jgi:alkanesulfonate monooxygenase SsuD/methylene tetrahydromethanopterin reductase-like flavin-dependent oxidoreductase (luciferase family)
MEHAIPLRARSARRHAGWAGVRFAAMGANIRTRPSVFEEALDIVRRLLAGETVSSSRRFRIVEASLALRPAEPVEVWIGASAPPAIDRTARLAEGSGSTGI